MAVLTHDELMALVNSRVSAENTDDDIRFLEDMTDTIASLESNAGSEEIARLQAENADLRQRYIDRFTSGGADPLPDPEPEPEPVDTLTYESLFKEEE